MRGGRVLHAGPAIVDVSMRVPSMPTPGGDVYATDSRITAGGGFNVMAAAARDGAEVLYLGARGDGAFSRIVDAALLAEGIALPSQEFGGVDVGYCIAFVDAAGERTFVSVLGAEGLDNSSSLESVEPADGDIVYVTGYSMLNEASRGALMRWLPGLPAGVRLVVDPSPLVADLPDDALDLLRRQAWLWTLNGAEALALQERFDPEASNPDSQVAPITWVTSWIDGAVVLREGADGCWVSTQDEAPAVHCPATVVDAVDTTGAGDAHTGVLMAALARGAALSDAAARANIAAAISVTRRGPATAPTSAEIEAAR